MTSKIFFSLAFLISSLQLQSQNKIVKGTVKNNFDEPIESVLVKIKGNNEGVFTDSTGFYSISVPPKSKLIFTQIQKGYKTQKASVKNNEIINISLKYDNSERASSEEKNINTGYGMVSRRGNLQSISSVDKKLLERETSVDMATFLKTVAGISVINADGDLRISIRGIRSINHNNYALILLNGGVYYGPLTDLNPRDIKSIDVLKDGSATSVYGSRGANGVVLITTK